MQLIDTHCHIHWPDFGVSAEDVISNAKKVGVNKIICVGTDCQDSQIAVEFAQTHKAVKASVGVHPHYAKKNLKDLDELKDLMKNKEVVAIGECGLDYYYQYSSKKEQKQALAYQLELAQKSKLPVIFHIRDAYGDFWPILDKYNGVKGVFHCFCATNKELLEILKRDFYIGLNGIVTFSKNIDQMEAFKNVPLDRLLLETDAPYLSPVPNRGKINEPKNIATIVEFLSDLRLESREDIATATTANANRLFNLE